MSLFKKIVRLGLVVLVTIILSPNQAYATEANPMAVSGDFQTLSLTCPPPDDAEQCVIDQLTGDLVGTNKLVTLDYTESFGFIQYVDTTTVTTQYGVFQGEEHGQINIETGAFHSHAILKSVDECGSTLQMNYEGIIDLETLEDEGEYNGVLILKECE